MLLLVACGVETVTLQLNQTYTIVCDGGIALTGVLNAVDGNQHTITVDGVTSTITCYLPYYYQNDKLVASRRDQEVVFTK